MKRVPTENPFHFTEYVEKQKKEIETDLGFFSQLSEDNKMIFIQTPVNTLIEEMEKLKNGFLTNGVFILCEEGVIETKRFFGDSGELAKFH